jgi:hypothetical protein
LLDGGIESAHRGGLRSHLNARNPARQDAKTELQEWLRRAARRTRYSVRRWR